MKKIVVPVDFSEYAEYAIKTAAATAKKYNLSIELISMIKNPFSYSEEMITKSKDRFSSISKTEEKMEQLLKADYFKGLKVNYVIKHYRLFSELGDFAKNLDADLIIMGTQGTNNIKDYFLGSNTEKAVRTAETPILVVKETIENIGDKKVLFVCNYRTKAIKAYKKAMEIFSVLNMTPTLLFVNKKGDKFLNQDQIIERISAFLTKADGNTDNLKLFKTIESKGVGKGAHLFAAENGFDMITIPSSGKSSVGKFFRKIPSVELSAKSTYPIMSIKI